MSPVHIIEPGSAGLFLLGLIVLALATYYRKLKKRNAAIIERLRRR